MESGRQGYDKAAVFFELPLLIRRKEDDRFAVTELAFLGRDGNPAFADPLKILLRQF